MNLPYIIICLSPLEQCLLKWMCFYLYLLKSKRGWLDEVNHRPIFIPVIRFSDPYDTSIRGPWGEFLISFVGMQFCSLLILSYGKQFIRMEIVVCVLCSLLKVKHRFMIKPNSFFSKVKNSGLGWNYFSSILCRSLMKWPVKIWSGFLLILCNFKLIKLKKFNVEAC